MAKLLRLLSKYLCSVMEKKFVAKAYICWSYKHFIFIVIGVTFVMLPLQIENLLQLIFYTLS